MTDKKAKKKKNQYIQVKIMSVVTSGEYKQMKINNEIPNGDTH